MRNIKLILALLVSLGVSACGGGGGDSGVGNSKSPLYIDSTNSRVIAATAIKVASGTTFELFNPDNFATDIYDALVAGTTINTPCTNNGSNVEVNLTIANGTMVYTNCVLAGKTFNGTIYVHNSSFDPNADSLVATLTFNSLTVNTFTMTGGYDLTANGLKTGISHNFRAKGNGTELTINSNTGQTEIISNFDFKTNLPTPTVTTYTSDFILASSSLGGSFSHQHSTALNAFPYEKNSAATSLYPYWGDANLSGFNPTSLKISVMGNENTGQDRINLVTSDGITNFISNYTWADLNAP